MKQQLNTSLRTAIRMNATIQHSVEILQMSYMNLSQVISDESISNPFLEVENSYEYEENHDSNYYAKNYDESEDDVFAGVGNNKSLYQHIEEQIYLEFSDEIQTRIAFFLLELLTPRGYIENYDHVLIAKQLKCSPMLVQTVLMKLQNFDPSGVFARDLKECLKIQLSNNGFVDQQFNLLIDNLELVAKLQYEKLLKICNVTYDTLLDMIKQIKLLTPNPAMAFDTDPVMQKVPEVILKIHDQNISIEINPATLPRILVNKDYYQQIRNNGNDKQQLEYVSQEYTRAANLVTAVQNRFKTLLLVATAIVEQQHEFFIKGIMYFKPLIIEEIAKITNLHESTISRTINGKYIFTPSGIYELKYFFSSKISTHTSGVSESSTKIKEYIRELISDEGKNVLSDEDISAMLERFGFKVARRTVAKYRETLGISTSSIRKRQKR